MPEAGMVEVGCVRDFGAQGVLVLVLLHAASSSCVHQATATSVAACGNTLASGVIDRLCSVPPLPSPA